MMILVGVVALGAGGERLAKRRAYFLRRAEADASRANDAGTMCLREEYDRVGIREELRDYWLAMARKYRHAARYPWLPVDCDPPLPD